MLLELLLRFHILLAVWFPALCFFWFSFWLVVDVVDCHHSSDRRKTFGHMQSACIRRDAHRVLADSFTCVTRFIILIVSACVHKWNGIWIFVDLNAPPSPAVVAFVSAKKMHVGINKRTVAPISMSLICLSTLLAETKKMSLIPLTAFTEMRHQISRTNITCHFDCMHLLWLIQRYN